MFNSYIEIRLADVLKNITKSYKLRKKLLIIITNNFFNKDNINKDFIKNINDQRVLIVINFERVFCLVYII